MVKIKCLKCEDILHINKHNFKKCTCENITVLKGVCFIGVEFIEDKYELIMEE